MLVVSQFTLYGTAARAAAPASPVPPTRNWATGSMNSSFPTALIWAIRPSTAASSGYAGGLGKRRPRDHSFGYGGTSGQSQERHHD